MYCLLMNIHEYRKKRLKWYNHLINVLLVLTLSLVIMSVVSIGMLQSTLNYFEGRSQPISDRVVGIISESADELLSPDAADPNQNLCDTINLDEITDQAMRLEIEKRCAIGPVTMDDIPKGLVEFEVKDMTANLKTKLEEIYNQKLAEGKAFLSNLQEKHWYLKLGVLDLAFAFLIVLFFINNDLVLTINYLSKKLLFLVPIVFLLPYLLFKNNFLVWVFDKVNVADLIEMPLPVNPNIIIEKVSELISNEFAMFYGQFLIYAFVAFFAGLILWLGNKYYILPFFARKHGYIDDKPETEVSGVQAKPEQPKEVKTKLPAKPNPTKKSTK